MVSRGVAADLARAGGVRGALRSLGWRLTVSYALVTLIAAGTMSVLAAGAQAARGVVSADRAGAVAVLEKDAAAATPYMDRGAAPDRDAVRFWIAIPVMDDLSRQLHQRVLAVAVFDAGGRLLVAESCDGRHYSAATSARCLATAHDQVAAVLADPAGRQIVQSAVHRAPGSRGLTVTVAGRGVVAVPVDGAAKQTGGAIVAILDGTVPPAPRQNQVTAFLALWRSSWPASWFPLILLAAVIGTTTGLFLSHRLIRRLRSTAATVRVWSLGDLAPTADQRGNDELADLARDLNQMAEQLRNLLATRREMATLQERRRVQRELHDGVKQELFAVSMRLAAARTALPTGAHQALEHLGEAQRSSRRAQHELTSVMEQLRPAALSAGGLNDAMAELGRRLEQEAGIPLERDVPAGLRLPVQVEEGVFRIVQEALTNVRRHARASRAAIRLTVEDGIVRLLVTDDGHGFDAGHTPGLGIRSMRERVEALGGSFEIRTTGQGACIEAALPIEKPAGRGEVGRV